MATPSRLVAQHRDPRDYLSLKVDLLTTIALVYPPLTPVAPAGPKPTGEGASHTVYLWASHLLNDHCLQSLYD